MIGLAAQVIGIWLLISIPLALLLGKMMDDGKDDDQ
jgi:hypothetical protein